MKRKCIALLTLLVFAFGVIAPGASALAAAVSDGKAYTAYDNTPDLKTAAGRVSGMTELRVQDGSDAGVLAYSLNMTRERPAALTDASKGTSPYKRLTATANTDWAALVDKAQNSGTIKQDVLNVIYNGYPYLEGSWKGVQGDVAGIGAASGLTAAKLEPLYAMAATQQAIWYYTDNQPVSGNLAKQVNELIAVAKQNPAPANFALDLYDASGVKTADGKKAQNLVAVSAAQKKAVSVKVNHRWVDEKGDPLTGVTTPAVTIGVYAKDAATPIASFNLNDATQTLAFNLFDDDQVYTLKASLSGTTEGFEPAGDVTVDLRGDQGSVLSFDMVSSHKDATAVVDPKPASVPLSAEVALDGKTPGNGSVTLELKDEAGNILQAKTNVSGTVTFDPLTLEKEGSYAYTLSMKPGSDSKIAYDAAVYKVRVTVDRDENGDLRGSVAYEKNGAVYTGLPAFANKTVNITEPTVDGGKKISVTVNKTWKNDKSSSRPSSVKMQLYRDGKAYGSTVTLNSGNGWKYTWSNLDDSYKWTVDEPNVPSGYTKSTKHSGNTWTITNTKKSTSTSTTSTKVTKPKATSTDKDNDKKDRSTPETGDESHLNLWTTIAIFSLSGMLVIGLIAFFNRRRYDE